MRLGPTGGDYLVPHPGGERGVHEPIAMHVADFSFVEVVLRAPEPV
jgi:hypothetical protein